jgi:muramoyltetrapeptide carboxypeptidase LdcA involved in peptidoglycan recycling
MRYPKPLKEGGTIGFIAPSFAAAIEPYKTRFENAKKIFEGMGYKTWLGPNCDKNCGLGISNKPELCGAELNDAMTDDNSDVIITCGGGELMCEVVPYIDFEKIKASEPKWYMGYSDNSNYIFLSTILADTAAMYAPCAPTFGREPWHKSVEDAFKLLKGEIDEVAGYDLWEKPVESEGEWIEEPDPLTPYEVNERPVYQYFVPGETDKASETGVVSGDEYKGTVKMKGRLVGGCADILVLHAGTKYDKVKEFAEKYKDDGIVWFLECCDLDPLSVRRAFWQMREAGWFKYTKGFLIGRPRHFGEEALGVDMYNAITDIVGEFGVPIIMDLDIGHLPPMMPIISGSVGDIEASGNNIRIKYELI